MKVLIVNAILYTSESVNVHKVNSVKDCMIYDLCAAFYEKGHDVTLIAAEEYKPVVHEEYPFEIIWMKSHLKKVFIPNKIPFNTDIFPFLSNRQFDMIICSEVFSIDTLMTILKTNGRVIVWQEMAFHQKMAKQMASKFWHNVILKLFYRNVRIIPRTQNAQHFIRKYSGNVSELIIPHGVNMHKFVANTEKEKFFVVSSQLIPRKRIDRIISVFGEFCENYSNEYKLIIIGDGKSRKKLECHANQLGLSDRVAFMGKMPHSELISYLEKAQAMLVYTEKDNSMISIAESIAVCTPVITTSVPDNSTMINEDKLGIVSDCWDWKALVTIVENNDCYIENCLNNRFKLDNHTIVDSFITEWEG